MPLQRCEQDGRPGWRWGDAGACYVFTAGDEASETAARKKALAQAAAMGEFPNTGQRSAAGAVEILYRNSTVLADDVNFADRIIEVIAAPWNEEAEILWRQQKWGEIFLPGAFDEAIAAGVRIPVNREHKYGDTVGRVVHMRNADVGLLASVKVAKTPRGDDTLQLAYEGALGASLGWFAKKLSDVMVDNRAMLRRVRRGFIEHLAMTEVPAFPSAQTIGVHDQFTQSLAAGWQPLVTPALDEELAFDIYAWAASRLSK